MPHFQFSTSTERTAWTLEAARVSFEVADSVHGDFGDRQMVNDTYDMSMFGIERTMTKPWFPVIGPL